MTLAPSEQHTTEDEQSPNQSAGDNREEQDPIEILEQMEAMNSQLIKDPVNMAVPLFQEIKQKQLAATDERNLLWEDFLQCQERLSQNAARLAKASVQQRRVKDYLDRLEAENDMCVKCEAFRGSPDDADEQDNSSSVDISDVVDQMEALNLQNQTQELRSSSSGSQDQGLLGQMQAELQRTQKEVSQIIHRLTRSRTQLAESELQLENANKYLRQLSQEAEQLETLQRMNATHCPKCSARRGQQHSISAHTEDA